MQQLLVQMLAQQILLVLPLLQQQRFPVQQLQEMQETLELFKLIQEYLLQAFQPILLQELRQPS